MFGLAKRLLPKISKTEMIALKSGTVSIDRHIMKGYVPKDFFKQLKNEKNDYLKNINTICETIGDEKIFINGKLNKKFMDVLKKNKCFSYIIDEKYGGLQLNVESQSQALVKLASVNPSVAVTVMVPNSLGPGELLQHYGTNQQKEYYLPKLASGEFIPCFGLTGPKNGSDAAGPMDEGTVVKIKGRLFIDVTLNKRYITLAPVSNLIGVAIKVKDPNNLIKSGMPGITVALLEKTKYPEVLNQTYHNPMNAGFPNGTLKGNVLIDFEDIIGGPSRVGHGWKMLMECLAAGRGVSLPASSLGACLATTYGITGYSNVRKQFNIPIIKMEGVYEKLFECVYNTMVIDFGIRFTNAILDDGEKPSVISAIMKQQTTERGKTVIVNGMDVHGGSGICQGPNNFISKFYEAGPIGITVEGSNVLTRSLIIFGQGLNKSHPYISSLVESIQKDEKLNFYTNLMKMGCHFTKNFVLSSINIIPTNNLEKQLRKNTRMFANLSNIVSLLGGNLKRSQAISGHMADMFSNLYLGYAVLYHQEKFGLDHFMYDVCLSELNKEFYKSFEELKYELPTNLFVLTKISCRKPDWNWTFVESKREFTNLVWKNQKVKEYIESQIYIENNVLYKIKQANETTNEELKEKLVDNIISVGEFKTK